MDSVLKRYTLVNTKETKQDDTEGGVIYLTSDQDAAFKKEGWRVVLGGILIHFVINLFLTFTKNPRIGSRDLLSLGRHFSLCCFLPPSFGSDY